jgi:hypothetical protein
MITHEQMRPEPCVQGMMAPMENGPIKQREARFVNAGLCGSFVLSGDDAHASRQSGKNAIFTIRLSVTSRERVNQILRLKR